MAMRGWLVGVGVLVIASSMVTGCDKKEPVKPPPGVTKEMEEVKPPTIDLGPPGAETSGPAKPAVKK